MTRVTECFDILDVEPAHDINGFLIVEIQIVFLPILAVEVQPISQLAFEVAGFFIRWIAMGEFGVGYSQLAADLGEIPLQAFKSADKINQ